MLNKYDNSHRIRLDTFMLSTYKYLQSLILDFFKLYKKKKSKCKYLCVMQCSTVMLHASVSFSVLCVLSAVQQIVLIAADCIVLSVVEQIILIEEIVLY